MSPPPSPTKMPSLSAEYFRTGDEATPARQPVQSLEDSLLQRLTPSSCAFGPDTGRASKGPPLGGFSMALPEEFAADDVESLKRSFAEGRQQRRQDAEECASELAQLRALMEGQVQSPKTEVATLRAELEAEKKRSLEVQSSLARALDYHAKREAIERSRAERAEMALRAAEATIMAGVQRQRQSEEMGPDAKLRRAERAEAALLATEAALSALMAGHRHAQGEGYQGASLQEEAERAEIALRLDRAEAGLAAADRTIVDLRRQLQEKEGCKDYFTQKSGGRLSTPRQPCAEPPATAWVTPCDSPTGAASNRAHRLSTERVARPTWDGQYLSSPKRKNRPAVLDSPEKILSPIPGEPQPETDQGVTEAAASSSEQPAGAEALPLPPSSRCWDWPLSRSDKLERVAMMDAQLLLYDQRALQEEVENLRRVCVTHGLPVTREARSAVEESTPEDEPSPAESQDVSQDEV
eukprot:TRINITY_DN93734_c0_g1_i1.p1 TRINITY_DN93734_c0_g1~~TRINITY_DN93734_c0_g1_i1.p1  ORF type:complete len:474 (-),score=111.01 TRINITY_DN93734_c0_g1_i1:42-1442(-)